MEELIDGVREYIIKNRSELKVEGSFPKFSDSGYKTYPISKNSFHDIKDCQDHKGKVCFIDGGNSEIFSGNDLSVSLIRVYCSIFEDNKKVDSKKIEFFCVVSAEKVSDEIFYNVKLFGKENEFLNQISNLSFSSFDETLKTGSHRIEISRISGVVRRISELCLGNVIIDRLKKNDLIVIDGSLQVTTTNEDEYMDKIMKRCIDTGVILCGFCKSTSMMTSEGLSMTEALLHICPKGRWLYYPIAELSNKNYNAELCFGILHENAKKVFLIEIQKEFKEKIDYAISALSKNSKDPVFLGYPYGMIDADRFARISNNDREYYKTIFFSKVTKERFIGFDDIKAHDILDSISF